MNVPGSAPFLRILRAGGSWLPTGISGTEVVKVVTLYSTNNRSDYWNGMEWCGSYTEEILTQDDALSIVIPEDIKATKDYIFAQFVYQYNVEGFDYCHFSTVDFTSKIIDAAPYK